MRVLDLFDLSGKVSIVTGGGYGLGRVLATALGEAISDVVICSRKIEKCEEAAHDIENLGVRALAVQCDINRDEDVEKVVRETLKNFQKIDVLVNNSGRTWGASPEDISIEDWQKVIDLNVTGTLPYYSKSGNGNDQTKKRKGHQYLLVRRSHGD